MCGTEVMNILGYETPVAIPADLSDVLVTGYGSYLECIKEAEDDFAEAQRRFFRLTLKDDIKTLEKAANRWQEASRILEGYAASLFKLSPEKPELRKYALDLMDRATKAAMLRRDNLSKLRKKIRAEKPDDEDLYDQLTKARQAADCCLMSFVNTQNRYRDLFLNGKEAAVSRLEKEKEAAERAEEERKLFPVDHIHLPGRIYPAIPIPIGERVPEPPIAYQLVKMQPTEAKIYDPVLDELVLKPGYVSPDGLVDDRSVIRDRKHEEVIIKLRGGDPEIWKEWKPKSTRDVFKEGSWVWEYYIRLSIQMAEDEQMRMFERRPYEDGAIDFIQLE